MSREIRRVPPNWEHPKKETFDYRTGQTVERYQPMYDGSYTAAMDEWIDGYMLWKSGKHPSQLEYPEETAGINFAEWWSSPPDHEYYHPEWTEEEATWYQVYETVSEGTPVTPPFETQDELIEYLVKNGDFWDQQRRKEGGRFSMPCDPWTREQAEKFVKGDGFAFSMVIENGVIMDGIGRKTN